MRILITGATGLIGNELEELLLLNQHTVHYLTTSPQKMKSSSNRIAFYWNPAEGKIDENCLEGVTTIVHLAGASISKRWTKTYKQELIESRILSTNLLFNLLKKTNHQVEHFISASGTAIYPDSATAVCDENATQKDTSFLANLVVKWEDSADQFQKLGIKVTKMRTGVVFSTKGGALPEMIKPIRLFAGAAFGSGKQMQSWIHLADLAKLYYWVIQNQIDGVINAVAPQSISNKELTQCLAKQLHRPLIFPSIPKWLMQLVLGEMHILLFNDKKIIPQRAMSLGFEFQFDTAQKAIQAELK